ncbi:ABC transporter ATP-binding protein [bacterium]|nr:MAG: ABC transporter ATP-binding protein [bacterium]
MIEIINLSKSFGTNRILQQISLSLKPGKVTALIGPNGAGKSTLIKTILGLVKIESGSILLDGLSVQDEKTRAKIGYMPQAPQFPPHMTVREIIEFVQKLRVESPHRDMKLLNQLGLQFELDKPFKTLSGGTKQKVSAVIAFLFLPEVLILDEPTAGLDPVSALTFKNRVREESKSGKTILYTSHILQEIEELADELIYLQEGKVVLQIELKEFLSTYKTHSLEQALAIHISKQEAA